MTPLAFSFATDDELGRVVELVQSAYRGEASRVGWTSEADLLDGQRIDEETLRDQLTDPRANVLLAREEDQLVACCELRRPAGEQDASDGVHDDEPDPAFFGMFAVQPRLQALGVGRIVLAEAERIAAQEWGAPALELTVIEGRTELIEWYERRGYERTGARRPFPYGDERFGIPLRDDLKLAVLRKDF